MRAACLAAGLALALTIGAACDSTPPPPPPPPPQPAGPPQLRPRETFNWTGERVSFLMPPGGWRQEGETGGGIKGARWVKERSVGEAIGVGDYYILADRNRSTNIREILARFDTFTDSFAWEKALRTAYAYTDTPFSALETEIAERVNREVSSASVAYRNRDREGAKAHLETALSESSRLHFSLEEVVGRVEFKIERRENPEWYSNLTRREATIAGEPAVIVDYIVKVPERPHRYAAREVYFVHNSHLFVCTFIGLQETLAVFEAVLASIEFPS